MRLQRALNKSYITARLMGIFLIISGSVILINPTEINIKISFTLILIGIFMIFAITEKSVPKWVSDAQIESNLKIIKKIIKELDLHGNAVFLPKSNVRNEERVLIPPNKSGVIRIPTKSNKSIFLTSKDEKNLGIVIPPAGLYLLKEIEKDKWFKDIKPENLEEKLQLFVGINLLKSISFKEHNIGWSLEIKKNISINNFRNDESQYPCPVCSAIITLITRVFNKKIRIYKVNLKDGKITYYLNFIKRR